MALLSGSAEKNYLAVLAFAAVLLLVAIVGFFLTRPSGDAADEGIAELSESLKALERAADGDPLDVAYLQQQSQRVETVLSETSGSDPVRAAVAPGLAAARTVQTQAAPYARVVTNLKAIADLTPPVIKAYSDALERNTRSASDSTLLSRQLVRLYRVELLSRQALTAAGGPEAATQVLATEFGEFQRDHRSLTASGVLDRATADYTGEALATIETAIAAVSQDMQAAAQVPPAAVAVATAARAAQTSTAGIATSKSGKDALPLVATVASVLALILIAFYVFLSLRVSRAREQAAKASGDAQQQAILSLLDEITNLANGDLTGELTVTADFTGNIADSLNYTVQTLRGLVGTINSTSVEIAAAASSTTQRVEQMSTAAEGQAREIVRTTQAITYASRSLEDVAGRAEKLADQAKGSVETAHNGAATVGRTIAGMSTLREQIQDTAKRIKRLGESSQEIGNIIEFINDIAEQTNTLALNASIQAAMAGEAGRGFAVVADEVQRLAERAASATRQIESLVKTIQADTQEAITSMERSTANVVGGAKSAEEAGLALTRIEASSQELAKVIQDIAGAARNQSAETTKLATAMQGIREISVQTSSTAHKTVESVGELNTLSAKLRDSVAGFKLPTDEVFG